MSPLRRTAFTIIELLVSIGVIFLLAAMALPVMNRVRESGRRTTELSNLRHLTAAVITYCQNNDGTYPIGRMAAASPAVSPYAARSVSAYSASNAPAAGADDYTWVNNKNCWSKLVALMPGLNQINSCFSVREGFPDADDFGTGGSEYGYPDDTRVGWIYWAGRDDLIVNGKLQYRSLRRQGQHLTPGSQTLWTCWCWDSAGRGGPSMCPHVGSNFVMYPAGVVLKPPPDGLGVALDDGSASFVHWTDLVIIPQANGWKLYYQP